VQRSIRARASLLAGLLVSVAFVTMCSVDPAGAQGTGRVEYATVKSASLGTDLRYAISLPASYDRDTSRRYPLVVFLHGLFNDERDWEGRGIQAKLEELRGSGKVGEFIVAIPFGASSFYLNGKDGTRYEDAIVKDFLPYVDSKYRTTGKASERAIAGISMGGFGALVIAFKHPELFTAVAAHCAAVFEELPRPPASSSDQRGTYRYQIASKIFGAPPDEQFFKANNPVDLARSEGGHLKSLAIYFDVGEQDRYGFAEGNRRLDAAMTSAGVTHTFHIGPGDHGWAFMLSRMDDSFSFLWKSIGHPSGN
jgi:S-formylglutathione hydrolase FrmB